jgi:gliding motility-associated-like protein
MVSITIISNLNGIVDTATATRPVYVTTRPNTVRVNDTLCKEQNREATLKMLTTARNFDWIEQGGTKDSINIWIPPPILSDSVFRVRVSNYPMNAELYDEALGMHVQYDNVCYTIDSAMVIVLDRANFSIIGDAEICVGYPVTLEVVGGRDFLWGTGETEEFITVDIDSEGTHTFFVTATDSENCRETKEITVEGLPSPNIAIEARSDTICRGSTIRLTAVGGWSDVAYVWNTSSFHTNTFIDVEPRETTTYSVTATVGNCFEIDSITIEVINCDVIYFPNAIRLSSLIEENRVFRPVGIQQDFNEYYLAIYNRWGQLIFESHHLDMGWNGTHQGENVRPGVYVFYFRLTNRRNVWEKTGTVTVVD